MAAADPPDLPSILARLQVLEAELAATKAELARKDRIIEALRKRLFGATSERLDPAQLQLAFDEIVLGKPAPPRETGGGPSAPEAAAAKGAGSRRRKGDLFPANLKVVIDGILVPGEVRARPGDWKEIGETHHDELDASPARLFWRRTILKKFISRVDRSLPPVACPAPEPTIPGTLCGAGLAAQIIVDKYCDHLPHYRQSQRFERQYQALIGRGTLNAWTHATAAHLAPIGAAIRAELFGAKTLQVDETPIDYLSPGEGKTKKGYLWVYLDALGGTVYYDWQLGRGHDCLLAIIGYDPEGNTTCYDGNIQCDGYSAYQAFVARYGGITLGGCLAHIRRKFLEADGQAPEVTLPVLMRMQELYRIERQLRRTKAPPDCRMLVRRARAGAIVREIKGIIDRERNRHLPKSKLGEAIGYALNQWEKFERYLGDGTFEIDNNLVENAIRPTKLGLKNSLFFGNAEAGVNNALLYTLIENCKRQGLDPQGYLAEVIKRLPANATLEEAAALTPARIAAERKTEAVEAA